jgi:hypothetical protein
VNQHSFSRPRWLAIVISDLHRVGKGSDVQSMCWVSWRYNAEPTVLLDRILARLGDVEGPGPIWKRRYDQRNEPTSRLV